MKILSVGVLMLSISLVFGQKAVETKSLSEEYIYRLKSGAAVVRLYMNKPKIDVLTKTLNNQSISDKDKISLQKELDKHMADRRAYVIKTINAFDSIYDFSNVYYIYDYDQKRFLSGDRKNIFVGQDGSIDDHLVMKEDFFLFLGRGGNDETFIFYQADGKEMPGEFPDRYSADIFRGIIGLFKKDKLGNYVNKLNEKLHLYYNKVGIVD